MDAAQRLVFRAAAGLVALGGLWLIFAIGFNPWLIGAIVLAGAACLMLPPAALFALGIYTIGMGGAAIVAFNRWSDPYIKAHQADPFTFFALAMAALGAFCAGGYLLLVTLLLVRTKGRGQSWAPFQLAPFAAAAGVVLGGGALLLVGPQRWLDHAGLATFGPYLAGAVLVAGIGYWLATRQSWGTPADADALAS